MVHYLQESSGSQIRVGRGRHGECTTPDAQFNMFEILQIAEEVERKGARFYLKAAGQCEEEERHNLYYELANWRAEHQRLWACIRRKYTERTGHFGRFDPDDYVLSNPQVMAGLSCFGTQSGCCPRSGYVNREQILREAIRRSGHIGTFYRGLKGFVRTLDCCIMIDNLIHEESRQVRLLTGALESCQVEVSHVRG
jgi:rubrerythrin